MQDNQDCSSESQPEQAKTKQDSINLQQKISIGLSKLSMK